MKRRLRSFFRLFYGPLTKALRRKLVTETGFIRHPEMEIPRPWDYVQFQAERNIHAFLHTTAEQIRNVVVVGAYDGEEVTRMSEFYPNAHFTLFEPSPKNYPLLQRAFGASKKVQCIPKACGDEVGQMKFYELPMEGNGSLLPPDSKAWELFTRSESSEVTEHLVEVTTLDREIPAANSVDLLWVDVQGAELKILQGANHTLSSTRAVFLEVALAKSPYTGGALMHQLDDVLKRYGHQLVLLGLDPWNFTGNALWIQNTDALVTKE